MRDARPHAAAARPGRPLTASPAGGAGRLRRLLLDTDPLKRDRDYRWLWSGQVVNGIGNQVLAVAGAADLFSAIFRSSLVQLDTPDSLRGRVMSIHILVVTSGPRLGDIEAAVVAALTNPQFAVVSGGVACVLGVAVVARRFPQLASYTARTTVRTAA